MNETELKKQIREINKRIAAGETVRVTLESEEKTAGLEVDADGARRIKPNLSAAENSLRATDARTAFRLDFGRADEISDAEIAEKIESAVDSSQELSAGVDDGDLPRVVLTRDENNRVWILVEKCSYRMGNHTITAPADYETDLASIPRIFWSILAPEELSLAAPLFHDLIYRHGGKLTEDGLNPFDGKVFERKETDDLFLELMKKAKIPRWKRTAAYWAVRGFAGFAWKNND